jgi:cytochrome c1
MQTITIFELAFIFIGSILIYTLVKTVWQEITNN